MQKYNNKTNKRHRLGWRYVTDALSNFYNHGIPEPLVNPEERRRFVHPGNQVDVYSTKRRLTFVVGSSSTLVFENGLPFAIIPADASDILL